MARNGAVLANSPFGIFVLSIYFEINYDEHRDFQETSE